MSDRATVELYVYYKVPAASAAHALTALRAAQADLHHHWPGLHGRVLRRADDGAANGTASAIETWMETYARPTSPLSAAEADALMSALADLPPGRSGPRHAELFAPLD